MNFLQLITIALFFLIVASSAAADNFADLAAAGIKLYDEGKYKDALQKLKKARRLSPSDNRIDYNLGNINYQLGRFEKARKNWQNAITNVDRSELRQKAYYNIANAFYREERYQEAALYYQKTLQINREDYETRFNLKLALHQFELQKKMKKKKNQKKPGKPGKNRNPKTTFRNKEKKTAKGIQINQEKKKARQKSGITKAFRQKKRKIPTEKNFLLMRQNVILRP